MSGGLEDGRRDVDHMGELVADAALVGDDLRPGDGHALPRAAEVAAICLVHLKGVSKAQDHGTAMWL